MVEPAFHQPLLHLVFACQASQGSAVNRVCLLSLIAAHITRTCINKIYVS